MANNGIYYSSGNTLNFTTNNTTWATITSGGTFQMSAVSATTYYNLPPATFTGGTVSGATNFTGGLTANTISATTYFNLPVSAVTNGTGISASTSNGSVTITNTSPDQTVTISGGTGITTGGTYPNFTIVNSAPDQTVTISGGTGITTGGTYPNFTILNSAPDQTVTITGGTNMQIVGTYPNFGINFTGSTTGGTSGDYLPLSGGTVSGNTTFTSGLTATTVSATTYLNLPVSAVTSGTGISASTSNGVVTITNTQVQGITGITAGSGISANTTGNVTTISTNISASSISNVTTVGQNLITLPNPSAISYLRINADNTVTSLTLSQLKTDLGLTQQVLSVGVTTALVNTFEDTGFSFPVTSGKYYRWKVVMSVGATNSSCFGVSGVTFNSMNYRFTCQNAATTVTIFGGVANDTGANAAFSSNGLVIGEGYINPSASGTFKLRFRSLTAGALTIRAGSSLSWEEVL